MTETRRLFWEAIALMIVAVLALVAISRMGAS